MTNQAVLKQDKTNKDFFYVYLKEVPVLYACVQEPKKKHKSETEFEYSVLAFVNKETKDYLEEEVILNKQFHEVGVDKSKMKKIKYPLSSQRDDENAAFDPYKGLYGVSLTLPSVSKKGKEKNLIVVDKDGKELTSLVGNGSICNIKCFGYRNQDGMLNIQMNIVQVIDLVHYEGGNGTIEDEELGISVKVSKSETKESKPSVEDTFDDESDTDPF